MEGKFLALKSTPSVGMTMVLNLRHSVRRGQLATLTLLLGQLVDQRGLPHPGVSDNNDLVTE